MYIIIKTKKFGFVETIGFNTVVESLFSFLIGSLLPGLQPTKVRTYGPIPIFRCDPEHDPRHGPTSG